MRDVKGKRSNVSGGRGGGGGGGGKNKSYDVSRALRHELVYCLM